MNSLLIAWKAYAAKIERARDTYNNIAKPLTDSYRNCEQTAFEMVRDSQLPLAAQKNIYKSHIDNPWDAYTTLEAAAFAQSAKRTAQAKEELLPFLENVYLSRVDAELLLTTKFQSIERVDIYRRTLRDMKEENEQPKG